MAAFTQEELARLRAMRRQESADAERERQLWCSVGPGYSETETVYVIEYREQGDHNWLGCSPFYDPLRMRPEETHSKEEAKEVAALILEGKRATDRGAMAMKGIGAVRIIERVASAKIITQLTRST